VAEKVAFWNETLRKGERITIDNVGFLFFDQEKNICFEQDRFFNLLLESYGLGKVHFLTEEDVQIVAHSAIDVASTIHAPEQAIVAEELKIEPNTAKVIEHPALKERSKAWKYVAAAACILPIGFYSYWLPMKTPALQSGILSIRDFNPFQASGEPVYQKNNLQVQALELPASASELQLQATSNPRFSNYYWDASTQCKVKVPKQIAPKEFAQVEATTAGGFDVIVGCFSNAQNAQNLVLKLQRDGFAARIIPGGTLIRVSAGNAHDAVQLAELQQRVSARQLQGWIYKN
jgi:cell division septation protein DedD